MIQFERTVERNKVEILLGASKIGTLEKVKDIYYIRVLTHSFNVNTKYKKFVKKMIEESYLTTFHILESERKNLPLRINRNLKPVPQGKVCKIIE